MSSRPNLGTLIAAGAATAVVVAVVAGYLSVGSPGDARALRFDAARLDAMRDIAEAAQCVYSKTGAIPASLGALEDGVRAAASAEGCETVSGRFAAPANSGVDYAVESADHIQLCATFARPTDRRAPMRPRAYNFAAFPELAEERAAAGRHCYSVRLFRT